VLRPRTSGHWSFRDGSGWQRRPTSGAV